MTPRTLLLLDTESGSLLPSEGNLVEVGMIRWSVEHRSRISAASWTLIAPDNPAENINHIPKAVLPLGSMLDKVIPHVRRWAEASDLIVAHNSDHDSSWLMPHLPDLATPWVCSCFDIEWPRREKDGQSLITLALAHGLAVMDAHRALSDCILLERLFERVGEMGADVAHLLERAMRPKAYVISLEPYEMHEVVKGHGFKWDGDAKIWSRRMFLDAIEALPFRTRIVNDPPTRRSA